MTLPSGPSSPPIDRIQQNVLAASERRLLNWLCARMPLWVTPDVLTVLGMIGAFAIFAGDIFDGDWRDAAIALFFNKQLARLARAGIPAFLLKGNHDAESVVTKSLSLPDLARSFSTRTTQSFNLPELRVALHGSRHRRASSVATA